MDLLDKFRTNIRQGQRPDISRTYIGQILDIRQSLDKLQNLSRLCRDQHWKPAPPRSWSDVTGIILNNLQELAFSLNIRNTLLNTKTPVKERLQQLNFEKENFKKLTLCLTKISKVHNCICLSPLYLSPLLS